MTQATPPLLMIPGPIEVSPAVLEAFSTPPPSHLAPGVIAAFSRSIEMMRQVWCAGADSQPFIVAGSGTIAMDMAVTNLIEPGHRVVVVNTGYFSDRIADMIQRRGAEVVHVKAEVGHVPSLEAIEAALTQAPTRALFATHVDTSTGVRVDAGALARLATVHGALSVFDGVCATAAERFEMEAWGADVYLTASQKAIGLPAGLALLVASARAMEAREGLKLAPPMSLDWKQWLPIMHAYESRGKSYFSTPATNLILALEVGLDEILQTNLDGKTGMEGRFELHRRAAAAMWAAWDVYGLKGLATERQNAAWTLSALRYPKGVEPTLPVRIKAHGAVVAGGLYPGLKQAYFRVGHMGYSATRHDMLLDTVKAVGKALAESIDVDVDAGVKAAADVLGA